MDTKRYKSNFVNEETNPCIKESDLTTKCLEENYYDQEKCVAYFKNYQGCKNFWGHVYKMRRQKGIKPYMPGSIERGKIEKEFNDSNKFVYATE